MIIYRHWLKVSISLTVVMGITWIIGVLVIELFALAFIFTILVAFQGLFIFIIFVLLSKQVRETYQSWWKAKVAESDFLSSYFGEKQLTLGTSASVSKTIRLHSHYYQCFVISWGEHCSLVNCSVQCITTLALTS